jgi:hypothetical protein
VSRQLKRTETRTKTKPGERTGARASLAISAALNANLLLRRDGSAHVQLLKTFTSPRWPIGDVKIGRKKQQVLVRLANQTS